MPFFRKLLRRREGDVEVTSPKLSLPLSPQTSPRSPQTSPKSPDLSETRRNPDALNQCRGCDNVDFYIRRSSEQSTNIHSVLLHNSFEELNKCARHCQICRVFRQALLLQQVTFDGVKGLEGLPGQVRVEWQETKPAHTLLKVEVKGGPAAFVNCNASNKTEHLALPHDALDPVVIGHAKQWLDNCLKHHVGRCDNLKWSSANPRFLVEILSSDSVRLCENQTGEYAALSYCWGNYPALSHGEQEAIDRGKTVMANVDQRRQPFSMDELPHAVRDALRIIHAMGVRYAWVDALCIIQDQNQETGPPDDVATMHIVYSNALFTLCACATTKATAALLEGRDAWALRTEPCKLGSKFLSCPDMHLNQLRIDSPLAERAWCLQEERLSPRMLYVSSGRLHWSCAVTVETELEPTYGNVKAVNRPLYETSGADLTRVPSAQEFLLACYAGSGSLHSYWADIVESYCLRSMTNTSDRLVALSGLAAKYLSASAGDEYLAGIWKNNLAEGLSWRLQHAADESFFQWPSWSWAVVPLKTIIETDAKSAAASNFKLLTDRPAESQEAGDAIKKGQEVKEIRVVGRTRPFWGSGSKNIDWSALAKVVDGQERFTFAQPEQDVHAVDVSRGRVLVYEGRRKEVVAQLDFRRDVESVLSGSDPQCLEIGTETMLLLEPSGEKWRRVGVAWNVRHDFFAQAETREFTLI